MKRAQRGRTRKLTAIDLFAGCGGLTLGLKEAGFCVLAAVELDEGAAHTYSVNHPEVLVHRGDIRKLSTSKLKRQLGLRAGSLDLLAGCPPCQGFSALRTLNGANDTADRRNALIYQMLRFAKAFKPKTIMMENVPALAKQRSFKRLCKSLKRLGYDPTFEIKDAAYYGVPQRRRRLILLAGKGMTIPFAGRCHSANGAAHRAHATTFRRGRQH